MRDYKIYSKIDSIIQKKKEILNTKIKSKENLWFLGVFNYCTHLIKDEHLYILRNSYFESHYQFWWMEYYSKSNYYRKRFSAVKGFVSLFEMIYENFNLDSMYFNYA